MDESIKKPQSDLKFVFVVGATATGKSALALRLAKKYDGSVVNCDSVQLYVGLKIGAATPTDLELQEAPHFLYSYVQPPSVMTAGQYIRDFYQLVNSRKLKSPVFIVGGTGFYIQALEKGMHDVEPIPSEVRLRLEKELSDSGPESLFKELKEKDPQSLVHINDHYRLVRALEIIRHTGKTPSQVASEKNKDIFPYPYLKIGIDLPREILFERVRVRTKKMIESGIIEETQSFLLRNLADWAPLESVGYKETMQYLVEHRSLTWLQDAIEQSTRQLIKKQKTWFKRDQTLLWSDAETQLSEIIEKKLDDFLS